jgi:DNA-binding NarL/FixJ family response regulator
MPLPILIVDDDEGIRVAIAGYLEMMGYTPLAAADGRAALGVLEKYHPHVLITDINMPHMDGYQLVREVRTRAEFRLLPVVFLSERGSTAERIKGYQMGCDLYLPKPFEMPELGAVIRNLLERSQIIQTEWRFQQAVTKPLVPEPREITPFLEDLSDREQQVLALLIEGLSNAEIGQRLHLSARTVEKYVSSLLRKTTTTNRAELLRFALEHNLVH